MQIENTFDVSVYVVSVPSDRILPTTPERIEAMKETLRKDGFLIAPILIRLADHNSYRVVVGATRLEAAKALGWTHIRAAIVTGTRDELALAEVSENIGRANLSAAETERLKIEELRLRVAIQAQADAKASEERKEQRAKQSHKAKPPEMPREKSGRPEGGINKVARDTGVPKTSAYRAIANETGGNTFPDGKKSPQQKPPPQINKMPPDQEKVIKATHRYCQLLDKDLSGETKRFWKKNCYPQITQRAEAI